MIDPIRVVRSAASNVAHLTSSLYDRSMDLVLKRPYEVTSRKHAEDLLEESGDTGDRVSAQQVQRIALIVTPLLRRTAIIQRIPGVRRFPVMFSLITVANVGTTIRAGVHEVQVVGSYLASRLRNASGREPDPTVVKRLTMQLYLHPSRDPDPNDAGGSTALLMHWLVNGLIGRSPKKAGTRALKAVERLDLGIVPSSLDVGTVAERTIAPALKAGG